MSAPNGSAPSSWKRSPASVPCKHAFAPHFLFNSTNTIAALTRSSPARAEQAVEDLADLFSRQSQRCQRTHSTEGRAGDRAHSSTHRAAAPGRSPHRVHWDVDRSWPNAAARWVPSLIVQPLLENAVYHGVETLPPRGGEVSIVGRRQNGPGAHRSAQPSSWPSPDGIRIARAQKPHSAAGEHPGQRLGAGLARPRQWIKPSSGTGNYAPSGSFRMLATIW